MQQDHTSPGADEPENAEIGVFPEPGNPGGVIDSDRVETSSGTAPTGGIPVGSAADRIQPDRSRWTGSGVNPNRPADAVDNVEEWPNDAVVVPPLGGVADATPPLSIAGGSVHGTINGGIAGVSPRTGLASGAVTGDVGAGMAGEERMDVDPDAD